MKLGKYNKNSRYNLLADCCLPGLMLGYGDLVSDEVNLVPVLL
jgi:hypothetical protein